MDAACGAVVGAAVGAAAAAGFVGSADLGTGVWVGGAGAAEEHPARARVAMSAATQVGTASVFMASNLSFAVC